MSSRKVTSAMSSPAFLVWWGAAEGGAGVGDNPSRPASRDHKEGRVSPAICNNTTKSARKLDTGH